MKKIAKFHTISKKQWEINAPNNKEDYDNIILPKRATKGSAGYDFFAPFDITLKAGEEILIPTGIRCEMEENIALFMFPRSGLGFKYRFQLNNTIGVIDSDYFYSDNEGHIMCRMINDNREGKLLEIKEGQGFAQGIFLEYGITIDDSATNIRNGGFGSTTNNNENNQ